MTSASILIFSLLMTGCAGFASSAKNEVLVKDSLNLRGECIISGKVVSDVTDEPIREANIVLLSNPLSAVTDLYGQFEMVNVPPGIYTIQIFCVGYEQKIIQNIESKPDRLIKLEIRMTHRQVNE